MSVTIPGTVSDLLVLEKCRQLEEDFYAEPKNEEILGSYLHANVTDHCPVPAKINEKKTNWNQKRKQKHLRLFQLSKMNKLFILRFVMS